MIKAVPLTCTGHSRPVTHLSFSDIHTGVTPAYLMISACKDGNPMLRNGVTGDWIGTFLGHKGAIWCSVISPDGKLAMTASADFSVIVWDCIAGQALRTLPHSHIARSCAFCPSDVQEEPQPTLRVVTAGQEKLVRIWDVKTTPKVLRSWTTGDSPIKVVLWPSPHTIVTAAADGLVVFWDLSADTSTAPHRITGHTIEGPIGQVEHDGEWIVVAAGTSLTVLDAVSGKTLRTRDVGYKISAASISKDRAQFVTGCSEDTWVRVHDYATGELLDTYKAHHGPVHAVSYAPDGNLVASGSEDGTIRLWKTSTEPYGLWVEA